MFKYKLPTMPRNKETSTVTKKSTVDNILDLLREGEGQIIYGSSKDVILMLGTTGSGKSTFTQFIAGYDNDLISQETGKNTREYIIRDKNNKISNNTFLSQTIFPDLVLDTETNTVLYDCPGFSDTRSPAHDIAATYFIKRILDHAERVKLIFTTNYSSVREGVDRQAFLTLVKNAAEMIKNVKKFDQSIGLIVTKVDNIYDTDENDDGELIATLRSDETIIESIASFLTQLKDYLRSSSSNEKLGNLNENAVQFINALLHKNDKKYANIGIFRRPNKVGSLTKIKLLQDRKPYLKKIIHQNIQFSVYNQNDFGYTISADSREYLHDLIEKINENIVGNIKNLGQEIEKYYNNQEEQLRDIQDLYNKFRLSHDLLSITKSFALSVLEPQQLLAKLTKNVNHLNINVSKQNFQNIINYGEYLKFIKTINGQLNVMKPVEWAQGLTDIVKYLDDSLKWYYFLTNVHLALSKYDVQRDYRRYSSEVDSLKYQIKINENDQEKVLAQLKQFLDQVSNIDFEKEYHNIQNVKVNKAKLKILTDLLNLTLKYNVDLSCDGNNLSIKGQYVRLNEITTATCNEAKFIEIFALNKVFIDTSFNRTGDEVQLSIIAPKLEVIGNQSIILDGKTGAPPNPVKAKNAIKPGDKGDDGKPGEPGGPAGHFLNIAQNVERGEYLRIFMVGGNGGPGQKGGDGTEGKNGTIPHVPKNGSPPTWGAGFDVKEDVVKKISSNKDNPLAEIISWYVTYEGNWTVRGQDCIDGGDGGNGGVGGKGGKSMYPIIINLIDDPKIVLIASEGKVGSGASAGNGTIGGSQRGKLLKLKGKSTKHSTIKPDFTPSYSYTIVSKEDLKECRSGKPGIFGKNDVQIKEPKNVTLAHLPSTVTNDYKKFLRNNLSNNIMESYLRKFLDDIEDYNSVKSLYDVFGFINEFEGLEDQFYRLRKQLSFLPFYKSLLNRLTQYTNKLFEKKLLTDENKKTLGYLYTATLSKIYSINNNVGNNLVMDLPGYLKLTTKEIERLKDLGSITSINEEQTKYQKVIIQKINEAQNFVDANISPSINSIYYDIDKKIELLIDENVALQNSAQKEKKELEKKQQMLQETVKLRAFFGVAKTATQFLSFVGPVGAAAGAVIGGGLMVAETLALETIGDSSSETITILPTAVKDTMSKIADEIKSRQALFKEQLADAQKELRDFKNEGPTYNLSDIEKKLAEVQKNIKDQSKIEVLSEETVNNYRQKITDLLENKKNTLEKLKPDEELKNDKELKLVTRIKDIFGIVQVSVDYYNKIKKDKAKIDELALAIKKSDEKLKELMLHQQKIYDTIIPKCKNIEKKVNNMENNLRGKSHAALDISKWEIQSTLRDIKLEMQQMTKGFKVQEDLARLVEKIEEGITVMINMYDRIQDYHDKAELVDHIANINSNRANKIQIQNEELKREIDNLKWIIQSNRVLEKYESSMDAFRQHIYPFAEYFIAEFDLPSSLKSNDTITLIATSVDRLNVLKSKLIESKITITKYDKFIHSDITFNSKENESSPFFVWKYYKHQNAIKKLLNGEKITMKSDIRQGLNKNAIKFNTIGINFKSANKTLQNELDEQLKNFKVEITHMGISYYRCENKFYIIPSDNQTISYTFAKKDNGYPKDSNDVYKKLKNYEPILSPYTLWNVQIMKHSVSGNNNLNLSQFKDEEIDLELEGTGQYIDKSIDVCNDDLSKYYAVDSTISEIDNLELPEKQVLPGITINKLLEKRETEYVNRKRRSLNKRELSKERDASSFATSGTNSNMKTSFINNVFNLIGTSLFAYDYINPLNVIGQWFSKKNKDVTIENFIMPDNRISETMSYANIHSVEAELATMSSMFIVDESSNVGSLSNCISLCNNGNLLLLDLVIRRKNGVKYQPNKFLQNLQKCDSEFTQNLAYRAYMPTV